MTNTILVNHTTGICVTAGNTATLEATLWGTDTWANLTDWSGDGTIITGSVNIWGDPDFVNPDSGDYHIGPGSAAIDEGVPAGVPNDIDSDPRTDGSPDIGADEFSSCYVQVSSTPVITYTTVQAAVDAAQDEDTVKVAGYCAGVGVRAEVTQTVYISKNITLRGGYTVTNWTVSDPMANPTTLDAQRQGRVIYITGEINPTVEGLRITGGDAGGLGGYVNPWGNTIDVGGGIYIKDAAAIISNNQVFSNTAPAGGGLFLLWDSSATLNGNTVTANSADSGGGLYLRNSDATLNGNTIAANTASYGGGLLLRNSDATLSGNIVTANSGGGLHLESSAATLSNNTVSSNTAGSGLYLWDSAAVLNDNTVTANSADYGGGLRLEISDATLSGNTVFSNTAAYDGGGLLLKESDATLSGNTISSNTAGWGGGLYLWLSAATLINNVVADNRAEGTGSGGLHIAGSSPRMLHTTIARNSGGNGSGLYATSGYMNGWHFSSVALTDTILVSHTMGVCAMAGNTATLEATLWGTDTWANETDWGCGGTVITGSVNIRGDPDFVDPDAGNYHIGPGSAARDAGVDAGVTTDIDGDPRPIPTGYDSDTEYDIGADEFPAALAVTKHAAPTPVQAGAQLAYTIRITNTGNITLTATITDVLPDHVTTTQPLVWTSQVIPAPSGVWTETVVITVEVGYTGTLTNLVKVTTDEGATGVYTETSTVVAWQRLVYLPLVLERWPPVPYQPTLNPISNSNGDGNYIVSWTEQPSHLADTYTLQEATNAAFTTDLRDVCTTAQQFCAVTGRLAGTYYYRVQGHNAWADSEWSATQSATVSLPGTPTLHPIDNTDGDGNYTVTWNATARASSYVLQEDTNSAFGSPTTVYNDTGQSWSAVGKVQGTYYYRVKAVGPTGQSGWSNTRSATVLPPANVEITHIEYNPPGDDVQGEYVRIENFDGRSVDMTGWTLRNDANHVFTFPTFALASGASVRVWTKSGTNTATDLYWGSGSAIWNNTGDCAYLRDSGGTPVDIYCY